MTESTHNSDRSDTLLEQLDLVLHRLGWDGEATNEDPYEHADAVACALLEDRDAELKAAREQVEILKGVIARAVEASNSISDRDAEDAIQEMLQHLLEAEPEGHDDRIEWARMEGANAMLEIIVQAGYGARGIADNRDGLRKTVAELAVSATIPRNPEPEFEAALLQREVKQLRVQIDAQREDAEIWKARCRRYEQHMAEHVPPKYWPEFSAPTDGDELLVSASKDPG